MEVDPYLEAGEVLGEGGEGGQHPQDFSRLLVLGEGPAITYTSFGLVWFGPVKNGSESLFFLFCYLEFGLLKDHIWIFTCNPVTLTYSNNYSLVFMQQ